jgi:hypothetical protein
MDMSDFPRRLLVCLLLTAGLAACGSPTPSENPPTVVSASPSVVSASPSVVSVSPSARPTPSSTAPAAPATSAPTTPERALPLILSRSGGIAGVQDQVKIDPDGTATVTHRAGNPTTSRLSVAELAVLRRLLTDPALAREAKATSGTGVCADGFQYVLRTPTLSMKTTDCGRSNHPTLAKVISLVLPAGGKGA